MKLINYKYGYLFDCSIHGKIVLSAREWQKVKKYLLNPSVLKKIQGDAGYHSRQFLLDDMARVIKVKGGNLINIRVSATNMLAKHFNLKRYKKANYMILINNK